MPAATHRNGFNPYVAEFRSELERTLHSDLFAKFSAVEPEARPWYGVGLAREAANSSGFLIVAPTHIVLAHLFSVSNVSTGVVHGDATPAAWRVETDGRFLEIDGASSPFAQAKDALHVLLPKLDGFLHARKVKNPSVQSVVVFPDGYSFADLEEIKNLLVMRFVDRQVWDWAGAVEQFNANRSETVTRRTPIGFQELTAESR